MIIQVEVTPVRCAFCTYQWYYKGKNEFYAHCPNCRHYVNLKKQPKTPLENESEIGTLGSFSKVTQPQENP